MYIRLLPLNDMVDENIATALTLQEECASCQDLGVETYLNGVCEPCDQLAWMHVQINTLHSFCRMQLEELENTCKSRLQGLQLANLLDRMSHCSRALEREIQEEGLKEKNDPDYEDTIPPLLLDHNLTPRDLLKDIRMFIDDRSTCYNRLTETKKILKI